MHRRLHGPLRVMLLLRVHDIAQTLQGNIGLAHLRDHAPQGADRPGEQGIIGNKGDKLPRGDMPVDAVDRAQHQHQQILRKGQQIAGHPVVVQDLHQMDPETGVLFVLLFKAGPLVLLPPEGAHHAHARQIFLHNGRKTALFRIGLFKGAADTGVEKQRVADHHRDKDGGVQRHAAADAGHKGHRQGNQHDHAHQRCQLLGHEDLDGLHVGGAALDDIARAVGAVPGVGQMNGLPIQAVAHALDKALRRHAVAETEQKAEQRPGQGHGNHDRRQGDGMRLQRCYPADLLQKCEKRRRNIRCRLSDYTIHREADHAGQHHIQKRYHGREDHAQQKNRRASPQKIQDQLQGILK